MPQSTKLRILLSAYQCGPDMGSVSQIGWEWYRRLASQCQLTLLTHKRNQTALEAAGAPLADSKIIYIDSEWFAGPLYRLADWLFPRSEHPKFLIASADFFRQIEPTSIQHSRRGVVDSHASTLDESTSSFSPMVRSLTRGRYTLASLSSFASSASPYQRCSLVPMPRTPFSLS